MKALTDVEPNAEPAPGPMTFPRDHHLRRRYFDEASFGRGFPISNLQSLVPTSDTLIGT